MHKIFYYFAAAATLVSNPVIAQTSQSPQTTNAPDGSRFEVVQSELAARWTFRLDKKCGHVGQLVSTEGSGVAWQEMQVLGLPTCPATSGLHYQIFTSGLAARHTFLIDTISGRSWILAQTGDNAVWEPFEN